MVNKYEGRCIKCKGTVPANGGLLRKSKRGRWYVLHLDCAKHNSSQVNTFVIGGKEYIRNAKGRCEDAPCCGCCTI